MFEQICCVCRVSLCACVSDEILAVCFQSFVSITSSGCIKHTSPFEVVHTCFHLQ